MNVAAAVLVVVVVFVLFTVNVTSFLKKETFESAVRLLVVESESFFSFNFSGDNNKIF